MTHGWPQQVLTFWFDELVPPAWFKKDEALDARIRERFRGTYDEVAGNVQVAQSLSDSDTALAAVIVLDQFPRNMFRGTPQAFASDDKALALAHAAVDRELDQSLVPQRRTFLYLPFEHSETGADQDLSVALFTRLGDAELLRYAVAHHAIIARFGRFPHRNAILGRPSTPEEIAFLATPGSSF